MNVQINKDTLTSSTALGASDQLAMLIDTHREAYRALSAVHRLDDPCDLGREPTAEEAVVFEEADDAELAAMRALCMYRCQTLADVSIRAAYLLETPIEMSDHNFGDLLESMAAPQVSTLPVDAVERSELDYLISVHRRAERMLDAACELDTPEATDSERSIFEAAQDAEAKALLAVCAYPCRTAQEGRARRAYLKRFIADDLLTDEQVLALAGCAPAA